MVELIFDESPCDFKNTVATFKNKFFLKVRALELVVGNEKSKVIEAVRNILFDVMPSGDTFEFRKDISKDSLGVDMSDSDFITLSSMLEYLCLYSIVLLDDIKPNEFSRDKQKYIDSSTGWFSYIVENPNMLDHLVSARRTPGIFSMDEALKDDSMLITEAIIDKHIHLAELDTQTISSRFARTTITEPIKILWQ